MIGFRRVGWNFALQRAAEWARRLGRPLVVFEALRAGHRWASDRFHRFVLEGMADHAGRLARSEALYYPYVEAAPGALLVRYAEARGAPENDATSRLSPYLHWGSVSIHQVFAAVAAAERWTPDRLGTGASGGREGWWGMSAAAEKFLDQAVTWRELGYNMAARRPDAERYESLPAWAQATLARHAADARPQVYGLAELERGATHDELWNAAQRQLVREGRIHNYLRMLWGKKVLEWSPSPPEALAALVELNNKYALDGRDPNSYSGIFWCFGRYDRPWAPERPVFGTVRYMSSQNTRRKMDVDGYIARYGPQRGEQAAPLRGAGR
jgi:deoxyribodipyrimidine photo-lyase